MDAKKSKEKDDGTVQMSKKPKIKHDRPTSVKTDDPTSHPDPHSPQTVAATEPEDAAVSHSTTLLTVEPPLEMTNKNRVKLGDLPEFIPVKANLAQFDARHVLSDSPKNVQEKWLPDDEMFYVENRQVMQGKQPHRVEEMAKMLTDIHDLHRTRFAVDQTTLNKQASVDSIIFERAEKHFSPATPRPLYGRSAPRSPPSRLRPGDIELDQAEAPSLTRIYPHPLAKLDPSHPFLSERPDIKFEPEWFGDDTSENEADESIVQIGIQKRSKQAQKLGVWAKARLLQIKQQQQEAPRSLSPEKRKGTHHGSSSITQLPASRQGKKDEHQTKQSKSTPPVAIAPPVKLATEQPSHSFAPSQTNLEPALPPSQPIASSQSTSLPSNEANNSMPQSVFTETIPKSRLIDKQWSWHNLFEANSSEKVPPPIGDDSGAFPADGSDGTRSQFEELEADHHFFNGLLDIVTDRFISSAFPAIQNANRKNDDSHFDKTADETALNFNEATSREVKTFMTKARAVTGLNGSVRVKPFEGAVDFCLDQLVEVTKANFPRYDRGPQQPTLLPCALSYDMFNGTATTVHRHWIKRDERTGQVEHKTTTDEVTQYYAPVTSAKDFDYDWKDFSGVDGIPDHNANNSKPDLEKVFDNDGMKELKHHIREAKRSLEKENIESIGLARQQGAKSADQAAKTLGALPHAPTEPTSVCLVRKLAAYWPDAALVKDANKTYPHYRSTTESWSSYVAAQKELLKSLDNRLRFPVPKWNHHYRKKTHCCRVGFRRQLKLKTSTNTVPKTVIIRSQLRLGVPSGSSDALRKRFGSCAKLQRARSAMPRLTDRHASDHERDLTKLTEKLRKLGRRHGSELPTGKEEKVESVHRAEHPSEAKQETDNHAKVLSTDIPNRALPTAGGSMLIQEPMVRKLENGTSTMRILSPVNVNGGQNTRAIQPTKYTFRDVPANFDWKILNDSAAVGKLCGDTDGSFINIQQQSSTSSNPSTVLSEGCINDDEWSDVEGTTVDQADSHMELVRQEMIQRQMEMLLSRKPTKRPKKDLPHYMWPKTKRRSERAQPPAPISLPEGDEKLMIRDALDVLFHPYIKEATRPDSNVNKASHPLPISRRQKTVSMLFKPSFVHPMRQHSLLLERSATTKQNQGVPADKSKNKSIPVSASKSDKKNRMAAASPAGDGPVLRTSIKRSLSRLKPTSRVDVDTAPPGKGQRKRREKFILTDNFWRKKKPFVVAVKAEPSTKMVNTVSAYCRSLELQQNYQDPLSKIWEDYRLTGWDGLQFRLIDQSDVERELAKGTPDNCSIDVVRNVLFKRFIASRKVSPSSTTKEEWAELVNAFNESRHQPINQTRTTERNEPNKLSHLPKARIVLNRFIEQQSLNAKRHRLVLKYAGEYDLARLLRAQMKKDPGLLKTEKTTQGNPDGGEAVKEKKPEPDEVDPVKGKHLQKETPSKEQKVKLADSSHKTPGVRKAEKAGGSARSLSAESAASKASVRKGKESINNRRLKSDVRSVETKNHRESDSDLAQDEDRFPEYTDYDLQFWVFDPALRIPRTKDNMDSQSRLPTYNPAAKSKSLNEIERSYKELVELLQMFASKCNPSFTSAEKGRLEEDKVNGATSEVMLENRWPNSILFEPGNVLEATSCVKAAVRRLQDIVCLLDTYGVDFKCPLNGLSQAVTTSENLFDPQCSGFLVPGRSPEQSCVRSSVTQFRDSFKELFVYYDDALAYLRSLLKGEERDVLRTKLVQLGIKERIGETHAEEIRPDCQELVAVIEETRLRRCTTTDDEEVQQLELQEHIARLMLCKAWMEHKIRTAKTAAAACTSEPKPYEVWSDHPNGHYVEPYFELTPPSTPPRKVSPSRVHYGLDDISDDEETDKRRNDKNTDKAKTQKKAKEKLEEHRGKKQASDISVNGAAQAHKSKKRLTE